MEFNETTVSEVASKLGLTPEVFTKSLLKDTPEAEVTPVLASLQALQVHKAEDFTARIERERREAAEAAAKEATKNAKGGFFDIVDRRILKDTGVAKLPEEAQDSLAYAERAYKEKFGTKADESAELRQLRDTLAAKDQLLQQKDTELQEITVKHATEREQASINNALDGPINDLDILVSDPKFLPAQRKLVKAELADKYTMAVVDGQVQFTDKATGKVKTDPKRAGNPMEAAALIAEFAPTVVSLKAPSQRRGAGVNASTENRNDGNDSISDYPTLEAYKKYLTESAVTLSSQVGQEKIAAYLAAQTKK